MGWDNLSSCLLIEASPPKQKTDDIFNALLSIVEPFAREISKQNYVIAEKIINSVVKQFNVRARVANANWPRRVSHAYFVGSKDQNDTDGYITVFLDGPGLKSMATLSEFNPQEFSRKIIAGQFKGLSNLISHELVHRWQYKNSKKKLRVSDISTSLKYISNPHEIAAWAHQIVDEVGVEKINDMISNNSLSFSTLGEYSTAVWDVIDTLKSAPDHIARKIKKRYMIHIINIAKNV